MASMQSASTIAFIEPSNVVSSIPKGVNPAKEKTSRRSANPESYLTNLLHSTLDLDEVLKYFFNEISNFIPCEGITYENESKNIYLSFGTESLHHCDYRIFTDKDFLGTLFFSRKKRFTEKELQRFEGFVTQLVPALRNALLYREAVLAALKDPLTGAGNRLALSNTLNRELHLAHRHNQPFSMLMIDIDRFKQVNDSFGHQAGDKVLQHVAEAIVAVTRQTDMVFRYGGEEFLVILTKTDGEGSTVIAERIRSFIENSATSFVCDSINVTVSIGSATLAPSETMERLIERSDSALYTAKRNGRNQVVCSGETQMKKTSAVSA